MSDADRSSIEIKVLLKNLDPTKTNLKHKDRLRRLNKFRNYVTSQSSPEFYDDDYSLLLLGSESPTAMEDDDLANVELYGLLRASGCPSSDHKDALKRSARPAISLLRFLCLEFESEGGKTKGLQTVLGELNGFAAALCALTMPQLRTMRLDIHIGKGDSESGSRGGSKDDACHLLTLLMARHTDTDYETPKPVNLEVLLPEEATRKEFENWLDVNASADVKKRIKENSSGEGGGERGSVGGVSSFLKAAADAADTIFEEDEDEEEGDDDVLGVFGKKSAKGGASSAKGGSSMGGPASSRKGGSSPRSGGDAGGLSADGKPTRWSQTQMASETKEIAAGAMFLEEEREKALLEKQKAEQEKQRLLGRDPLGIRTSTFGKSEFDLREMNANRELLIQQALNEIEEEIAAEISMATEAGVERVNWLEEQRQALLGIVESRRMIGEDPAGDGSAGGGTSNSKSDKKDQSNLPSILPTDPNFDPILFLTLVHRHATYEELQDSTSRLSRKTDSQVERLQNLVRENFSLFIKCSEGIDVFGNSDGNKGMRQLHGRFRTLDGLAESCSEQARKSFKPLLDNTNEVRKVQSALAVLQRVAPLLQIPSLMRQHIENAQFSHVVKAYRKVQVIDKNHCDVELLRYVRTKAGEAAWDARHDLELILADETSGAGSLLDAVRDLSELLELLEQDEDNEEDGENGNSGGKDGAGEVGRSGSGRTTPRSSGQSNQHRSAGVFTIDRHVINVRDYPPSLACLLLQCTHFRSLVGKAISQTEATTERIFRGEGPDPRDSVETKSSEDRRFSDSSNQHSSNNSSNPDGVSTENSSSQRSRDKRWKYEALEARVMAALRAVALAKNWLPRLLQIGLAVQEAEKRRVARRSRVGGNGALGGIDNEALSSSSRNEKSGKEENSLTAHFIYTSLVTPALTQLVEHVAFCSLGCANQGSKIKLAPTFGKSSSERLRVILQSPLPPTQTAKCALELAELVEVISESNEGMFSIRPLGEGGDNDVGDGISERNRDGGAAGTTGSNGANGGYRSPLEKCYQLANSSLVMIERRVCIYSFDACARKSSISASGSGTFDRDLLTCVQKLSEDLTRPEECISEVEKGCLLVVTKCCEGLTSYVKDRSDAARLRVVAECADALHTTIVDVVREVSYLTNDQSDSLEGSLSAVISGLEGEMFDVFLDSVKRNVASAARIGLIESEADSKSESKSGKQEEVAPFPPYLAASFLSIVRCRAQVERALRDQGDSQDMTYQFLALRTASDGVVENICLELRSKLNRVRPTKADAYSIHLQFLINTLKKYLSEDILSLASDTRRMLLSKAGSGGRGMGRGMGNGPEGLAALENLERLGRVYVLCLGD